VSCVLIAGTGLLPGGVPAGAQGVPVRPPDVPDAYALLAFSKLNVNVPVIACPIPARGTTSTEGAAELI
jgi:hypothetical protein